MAQARPANLRTIHIFIHFVFAIYCFPSVVCAQADSLTEKLPIKFSRGSSTLSKAETFEMNTFCAVLKSTKKVYLLKLQVICDSSESAQNGTADCTRQLMAVKKHLVYAGLDSNLIEVAYRYSNDPVEKNQVYIEASGLKKNKETKLSVSALSDSFGTQERVFLQDLDFEPGRHELLPSFEPVLDSLVMFLKIH